jgi:hypothetical protein
MAFGIVGDGSPERRGASRPEAGDRSGTITAPLDQPMTSISDARMNGRVLAYAAAARMSPATSPGLTAPPQISRPRTPR